MIENFEKRGIYSISKEVAVNLIWDTPKIILMLLDKEIWEAWKGRPSVFRIGNPLFVGVEPDNLLNNNRL